MARIGLIGNNSVEYIEKLIDVWNNGDCAVLLDPRIPPNVIIEMLVQVGAEQSFIGINHLEMFQDMDSCPIKIISFDDECTIASYLPQSNYDRFFNSYSETEAVVIYSSGTTGKSKGIILTHFAINTNADAIIDYMHPKEDDCIYIAKNLFHSSTLIGELLVGLKTHARILIAPTVVPPRLILSNIQKNRVTILGLNPTLLSMLTDQVERSGQLPETLRSIYVSGSILNDKVYEKAHRTLLGIEIYNVYGLSEAGPRVTAQTKQCCTSNNSVGKPIKGVEVAIVAASGVPVRCGERGIIHVNTPSRHSGYINGEEKHMSLYKGWLNTGDIGFIDTYDELHVVGRVDDMIIYNAHKIYLSDIEGLILEDDRISDCNVSKFLCNDAELIGCIYVGSEECSIDLRSRLRKTLMPYEIPKKFVKVDSIPRNSQSKVDREKVKKILSG